MTDANYFDVYEALLRRSLERGVPSGVVADVFELPIDVVKEMSKEVKIERFRTADQAEYLENLQLEILERTEQIIRHGSPDQVARIATTVLGRQIAVAGKRPSSTLEEQRSEILETLRTVREAPARTAAPGRFVAGNVGIDRRANRPEEDDDE